MYLVNFHVLDANNVDLALGMAAGQLWLSLLLRLI